MSSDVVNHPAHYKSGSIEAIQVIESFGLGFHLGNVVKYILRHEKKGGLEDLKKARWYLDREIQRQATTPVAWGGSVVQGYQERLDNAHASLVDRGVTRPSPGDLGEALREKCPDVTGHPPLGKYR